MLGELSSASFRFTPSDAPTPAERGNRPRTEASAVGVDYLIAQAGGADAVLRAASRRLPRVLRQANMLELTDTIKMVLVEFAPEAFEQLADGRGRSLDEAAARLARRAAAPRGIV